MNTHENGTWIIPATAAAECRGEERVILAAGPQKGAEKPLHWEWDPKCSSPKVPEVERRSTRGVCTKTQQMSCLQMQLFKKKRSQQTIFGTEEQLHSAQGDTGGYQGGIGWNWGTLGWKYGDTGGTASGADPWLHPGDGSRSGSGLRQSHTQPHPGQQRCSGRAPGH